MLQLYKNIKHRRIALGLSQDELAQKTGYTSRSSIAKIESGKVDLPQTKIKLFAEALETTQADLMGWSDEDNTSDTERMLFHFNKLNSLGQSKAIDYVADLADNPKYQMEVREPDSFYVPEVLAASRPNKEMTDVDKEDLQNVLKLVAKEKQNGQK